MSQPADLWVKINIYSSTPFRFWGCLLHSIFVAIDNWYTKALLNRYFSLREGQTIEFTMPKISLEIVNTKFSCGVYIVTYYEFSEEKILINLECFLNVILLYWASKQCFWKSFHFSLFFYETNRHAKLRGQFEGIGRTLKWSCSKLSSEGSYKPTIVPLGTQHPRSS